MRFLLYPRTKRLANVAFDNARTTVLATNHTNTNTNDNRITSNIKQTNNTHKKDIVKPNFMVETVAKQTLTPTTAATTKTFWGQQCNENCGCVVRFQATIDPSTLQVLSVDYTAKTIVTTTTTSVQNNWNNNNTKNSIQRHVVKTLKGRPMIKECTCQTVHTLSKRVVEYIKETKNNNNWVQLYTNLCNFEGTRSSKSFQQAVLVAQQLPIHDGHCFDVVEEAITAMIKGYMPVSRHEQVSYRLQQYYNNARRYRYGRTIRNHKSTSKEEDDDDDLVNNEYDHEESSNNSSRIDHPNERYSYRTYHAFPSNVKYERTTFPFGTIFNGRSNGTTTSSTNSSTSSSNSASSSMFLFGYNNNGGSGGDDDDEYYLNNTTKQRPTALSTLKMCDLALLQQQEEEKEKKQRQQKAYDDDDDDEENWKIQDWISYVDHQYSEYFNKTG